MKDVQEKTTACNKVTDKIEQDPRMMQSVEEHQDIRTEDIVVRPVNGLKKRRRG
jgi:hypothetical protein